MENENQAEKRRSGIKWWVILILLVGLPVVSWFVAASMMYTQPRVYESRALIELVPRGSLSEPVKSWTETEMGVVSSAEVLLLVVGKLDLETRWNMTPSEAIAELRGMVAVQRVGEGRIVEITCEHAKKEEAREVAKALYEAYRDRTRDLREGFLKESAEVAKVEYHNQSDRTAELRKRYFDIYEKVGGEYQGDLTGEQDMMRRRAQQELDIAKGEFERARARKHRIEEELENIKHRMAMPVRYIVVHEAPEISEHPKEFLVKKRLRKAAKKGFFAGLLILGVLFFLRRCCTSRA